MKRFLLVILLLSLTICTTSAHSGGTDSHGGHHDGADYHYHHGYPAHQHTNGTCPYDFDDHTRHPDATKSSSVDSVPSSSEPASESRPDHSIPAFVVASTVSLLLIYIFYQRSERKRLHSDLLAKDEVLLSLRSQVQQLKSKNKVLEKQLNRSLAELDEITRPR